MRVPARQLDEDLGTDLEELGVGLRGHGREPGGAGEDGHLPEEVALGQSRQAHPLATIVSLGHHQRPAGHHEEAAPGLPLLQDRLAGAGALQDHPLGQRDERLAGEIRE